MTLPHTGISISTTTRSIVSKKKPKAPTVHKVSPSLYQGYGQKWMSEDYREFGQPKPKAEPALDEVKEFYAAVLEAFDLMDRGLTQAMKAAEVEGDVLTRRGRHEIAAYEYGKSDNIVRISRITNDVRLAIDNAYGRLPSRQGDDPEPNSIGDSRWPVESW